MRIGQRDAEALAAHVLGRDRAWLLAHPEAELTSAQAKDLQILAERRAAHEPLQYILGSVEFYGLHLRVTPDVLIPRPETELLVEQVLLWAAAQPVDPDAGANAARLRLADIGTGSGAIAIALATHLAAARITALDLSPAALLIAEQNAREHECAGRIRFLHADLLDVGLLAGLQPEFSSEPTAGRFDAVVSNPPYVPAGDAAAMQPEVVSHEPHLALFAGEDGLEIIRRLIPQAHAVLRPGGLLAFEFGFGQREPIRDLLRGWLHTRFIDDYAGIPRLALALRS